jgi:predicted nucleic acid-binding protein
VSYLVDSDWLIDAFVGVPTAVQLLAGLRGDGLAVSIISYGELFAGALSAPDPATELARFRTFLARLTLVSLDDAIMEIFARTRGELRRDAGSYRISICSSPRRRSITTSHS